ncbi:MAG: hypothetical protein AAGA88_01095 [Pseudomonadota bacterium]
MSKVIEVATEDRTVTTISRPFGDQIDLKWAMMPDTLSIAITLPLDDTKLIRRSLSDFPAAYILQATDGRTYVGQTCELRSRLLKHRQTEDKSHFSRAFIIASRDGAFDKHAIERREFLLTEVLENAGISVERGKRARDYEWDAFATPIIDRQLPSEIQMLSDLGLRFSPQVQEIEVEEDSSPSTPSNRAGQPQYFALASNGVRATAIKDADGSILVLAGSTYRITPYPSLDSIACDRRTFLQGVTGLLVAAGGNADLLTFSETVRFETIALAGRVLTGATYPASRLWVEVGDDYFLTIPASGPITIPERLLDWEEQRGDEPSVSDSLSPSALREVA